MSIFKAFLLFSFSASIVFPYSENCGSPLITGLTLNSARSTIDFNRSQEIGSSKFFSVRNLSTNELEEIEFKLLSTDGVSNFYGEIAEISNDHIDLTVVEELFYTFTASTLDADSLNLQSGIRTSEESILGPPPTINDGTIVNILLLDIRDGYSNSGEFVAGFFDPQDQYMCLHENGSSWLPSATIATCSYPYNWQSNSNGENIIYIDSNPSIINENGLGDALFTLAHEYQHLLHWNADIREGYFGSTDGGWTFHNPWLNEGISDLMPSILGLGARDFSHYLENPLIGLDEWSEIGSTSTLPYYAKSALFFQYLYELKGLSVIKNIFTHSDQGLLSVKSQFDDKEFKSLYINWIQSLVRGELEITPLNSEVYSENIENYISIGMQSATIETGKTMPEYSFALYSVPDYLSTLSVNSNSELKIFLSSENEFFESENIIDSGVSNVEKIIVYTQDVEIDNPMYDIFYKHISSPAKNDLFIFPNPISENVLSYRYFSDMGNGELSLNLLDLRGRMILSAQSFADDLGNHSGIISLNISSGIYILNSLSASGASESRLISVIK